MTLKIETESDIQKFLNFMRTYSKGDFLVNVEIFHSLYKEAHAFAKKHNLKAELVIPDDKTIFVFTSGGAAVGAGIGWTLGSAPGALIGFGLGSMLGYAAAHIRIVATLPNKDSHDGYVTVSIS